MALPNDLTIAAITFGPYTDSAGAVALVGKRAKLFPVDPATGKRLNLVHVATGQEILPVDLVVTIGDEGTDSVGPVPHTDNPGLSTVGFAYRVEWDLPSGPRSASPGNKTFAVPAAAGVSVDFDLLDVADAVPGILVPLSQPGTPDSLPDTVVRRANSVAPWFAIHDIDVANQPTKPQHATRKDYVDTGLAGKQDAATLAADTAAHVADGSALDVALRAASVAAVEAEATVEPTGQWDFNLAPTVNGVPVGSGGGAATDATPTSKGAVQLAGDLGGTATAPTVVVGSHHTHTAAQVSDSTATGRSLLTATDASAARAALSAPLGTGITEVRALTQAAYDAITTKSATTLYVIQG